VLVIARKPRALQHSRLLLAFTLGFDRMLVFLLFFLMWPDDMGLPCR
jgi:hypothetical protein